MSSKEIWFYIAASYSFSWLMWLPLLVNGQFGLDLPTVRYQHFLGAFGPCFGALVTSVLVHGSAGLKSFLRRALNPRISLWCYVFAVTSPFLFFIIAAGIAYPFEGSLVNFGSLGLTEKISSGNFLFVWVFWIVTYGVGEEVGWRGYLLPKIAGVTQTATAAVIVAQYWALWHLPAFFYDGGIEARGMAIIGWYIGLVFGSILLAWLTRNARWSVIPAIIWHGTFNLTIASDQAEGMIAAIISVMVIVTAIVLRRVHGQELAAKRC